MPILYQNIFIAITLFLINLSGCKQDPVTPVKSNPLGISYVDVGCSEIVLMISIDISETNRTIILKQGDSTILSTTIVRAESLYTVNGLLPNHLYEFTLSQDAWKKSTTVKTIDTTSHSVSWQLPDTIGDNGIVRDIWVFSNSDIWAVGEISQKDSLNNSIQYNAAHWDGNIWKLVKIPSAISSGGQFTVPLNTIYAFNENDIWTFSDAGSYSHWNGIKWVTEYVNERTGGGTKLWGLSSSQIYLVGTNGSISFYNGKGWAKMTTGISIDLEDIWGIDKEHIWACGTSRTDGRSIILQYVVGDNSWKIIYDSMLQPMELNYQFSTIWTDNPEYLYVDGGSGLYRFNTSSKLFSDQLKTGQTFKSFSLRGVNRFDIYDCGAFEVSHFNGLSWMLYQNSAMYQNKQLNLRVIQPTKNMIVTAGYAFTGINAKPVIVRGFRN